MADAIGAILLLGITLYAALGGADFGAGFWDLLAGGDRRGQPARALIDESITPVWEANHVWLVFDLVIFWTAFPLAFAAVMTTLAVPLWLAAGGIVLRGAGFAFRKEITRLSLIRSTGAIFAFSSFMTPFFMGAVIGGIASGNVPTNGVRAGLRSWTNATSLLAGFLFVGACAYLAAVYLQGEAARREQWRLERYFARRAQAAAVVAGALSLGLLAAIHASDDRLYGHLTGRALPLIVIAAVCGAGVFAMLAAGFRRGLRPIAAIGVAAVIWGWGVAQYPVLLPGTSVGLTTAGAPRSTLFALVVVFIMAVALVVPAFLLLYWLQSRQALRSDGSPMTDAPAPEHGALHFKPKPPS